MLPLRPQPPLLPRPLHPRRPPPCRLPPRLALAALLPLLGAFLAFAEFCPLAFAFELLPEGAGVVDEALGLRRGEGLLLEIG